MPSLQEILEGDLNLGGTEKIASQGVDAFEGDSDMEKIASELGLFGDSEEVVETEKVAAVHGIDGLYNELFPEDDLSEEKTAQECKVAAAEEQLGAMAYEVFAGRFDQRIEKIAADILSGDATVSAPKASISGDNPHGDSRPGQTQPGNRPSNAEQAIDTDPEVTNLLPPQSGAMVTGDEQTGESATEKAASIAAFRKHLLLANMG